jgi:hypothetical protein
VLLLRVWHSEQIHLADMVHLSAKTAEAGALRLQIAHQNFHPTFSHIFPVKVLMNYNQAMRDYA